MPLSIDAKKAYEYSIPFAKGVVERNAEGNFDINISDEDKATLYDFMANSRVLYKLNEYEKIVVAVHFCLLKTCITIDENGNPHEQKGRAIPKKEKEAFTYFLQNRDGNVNEVTVTIGNVPLKFKHPSLIFAFKNMFDNHGLPPEYVWDLLGSSGSSSKFAHTLWLMFLRLTPDVEEPEIKILIAKLYSLAGLKSADVGDRKHVIDRISKWIARS